MRVTELELPCRTQLGVARTGRATETSTQTRLMPATKACLEALSATALFDCVFGPSQSDIPLMTTQGFPFKDISLLKSSSNNLVCLVECKSI
jgi:hypothetical protein